MAIRKAPRIVLYRRLGFRSFGRIRNYPRGESRIFFVKTLKRKT